MAIDKSINIIDIVLGVLKRKKLLSITFLTSIFIFYILIYFFIPPKFESHSIVIPSQDNSLNSGFSGIMKNLKDLPLGLGLGGSSENSTYLTIIYSRSNLKNIIKKFNLKEDYNVDYIDEAVKILKKDIDADINDEDALTITVSAYSAKKAADINNFILSELNRRIVELNVTKSRDNRVFLETRFNEISTSLAAAEDSLQHYQEKSKFFEVEEQSKLLIENYSKLEAVLLQKKMELEVMKSLYSNSSPLISNLQNEVKEYEKELNKIKSKGKDNSLFIAINSLPQNAKTFLRLKRDVEIYGAILEFLLPIYEQAKFEEQKDIPVLQIVDYGNIPQKKAYPPRILFTLIASLTLLFVMIICIIINDILKKTENEKLLLLKEELSFRKKI